MTRNLLRPVAVVSINTSTASVPSYSRTVPTPATVDHARQ